MKKLQLFDQNHGLSVLQKGQFCLLFKSMFILSRKACILTRTSRNFFSLGVFCRKRIVNKNSQFFDQIHGLTPFEKFQCCGFLFSLFRKGCLIYKTSRIVFYDLFSRSMTWEYSGLHEVTGSYKALQGVTGGYKGLQGVTRG